MTTPGHVLPLDWVAKTASLTAFGRQWRGNGRRASGLTSPPWSS